MQETFSLGRLAGVRVGVNWSVLVIFALIAVGLGQGRLPAAHPDRPEWLYWLVALVAGAVFLASLLAHELAHAIAARRNGIEVDSITLWLLGGAARLRDEAPNPGAELRIAGVGPLVSLVLGVAFAAAAWLTDALTGTGLVAEALAWLAGINLLLAVFNAVPAAPLDGGRLLRAFIWWRTGNRLQATVTATAAGRVLGWLLIGLGLYLLLLGAAFSGIWLAVIGWFLVAAATAEGSQAKLRELLAGIPVRQAMSPDPVTAPATTTVAEFLDGPLFRYRHSAFPVTENGETPVGLVTLNRIKEVPVTERDSTTLAAVMVPLGRNVTATPDDPLGQLLPRLEESTGHRVLVLEGGRLIGIVSPSDISRITAWLSSATPWSDRRRPPRGPGPEREGR